MLYFAYGMNTNKWEMSWRCPQAQSLGRALLLDHEFRFSRHADVVDQPGMEVHGVLWDITNDCLQALDMLEGYPHYYERKTVDVIFNDRRLQAMTYYMVGERTDLPPTDDYVSMLLEGYDEHNVDTAQIFDALHYIEHQESILGKNGRWWYDHIL